MTLVPLSIVVALDTYLFKQLFTFAQSLTIGGKNDRLGNDFKSCDVNFLKY